MADEPETTTAVAEPPVDDVMSREDVRENMGLHDDPTRPQDPEAAREELHNSALEHIEKIIAKREAMEGATPEEETPEEPAATEETPTEPAATEEAPAEETTEEPAADPTAEVVEFCQRSGYNPKFFIDQGFTDPDEIARALVVGAEMAPPPQQQPPQQQPAQQQPYIPAPMITPAPTTSGETPAFEEIQKKLEDDGADPAVIETLRLQHAELAQVKQHLATQAQQQEAERQAQLSRHEQEALTQEFWRFQATCDHLDEEKYGKVMDENGNTIPLDSLPPLQQFERQQLWNKSLPKSREYAGKSRFVPLEVVATDIHNRSSETKDSNNKRAAATSRALKKNGRKPPGVETAQAPPEPAFEGPLAEDPKWLRFLSDRERANEESGR